MTPVGNLRIRKLTVIAAMEVLFSRVPALLASIFACPRSIIGRGSSLFILAGGCEGFTLSRGWMPGSTGPLEKSSGHCSCVHHRRIDSPAHRVRALSTAGARTPSHALTRSLEVTDIAAKTQKAMTNAHIRRAATDAGFRTWR